MQQTRRIIFGIALLGILIVVSAVWINLPRPSRVLTVTPETTTGRARAALVVSPAPVTLAHTGSVLTQLRFPSAPEGFLQTLRQTQGVLQVEFDSKSSTLAVHHLPSGPSAKALAKIAADAGVIVRGEVLDLPLAVGDPHMDTCGSCGLVLYEKLQQKPGVHAVEVFLPVKNQLRLLVEPESITPTEVERFFADSQHGVPPSP